MLPIEGRHQDRQGRPRMLEWDKLSSFIGAQYCQRFGIEGIARGVKNARRDYAKLGIKPIDMQFRNEELRNVLRRIGMGIGAPCHFQPVQRINASQRVAQWL